jgi:diacylglycerol kinase (ATP)
MSVLTRTADVEAIWPTSAAEAADRAREAVAAGVETVVAMGGDGMVHHVAQGVVGTEASLGIIPVGTTNVVARWLELPTNPTKAARLIAERPLPRGIGVAEMNLQRGATESRHVAVFSCGFGLDAAVVRAADSEPYRKYRFGSLHYLTSALAVAWKEFPKRKPHISVKTEGRETMAMTALIQFRSIYTYFGVIGLNLAMEPPDPMNVLTLRTLKRRRIPQIALTALRRADLASVKDIETWTGIEGLTIEADPPVEAQADGESLGIVDGGTVRWLPDALNVLAPQISP